jgi:hypothetical protein
MRSYFPVILAGFILTVASSAFAQTVKVNWQTHASFANYHTYAWRPTKHPGSHFYRQWVEKDVDGELAQKGLRRVEASQHPDLYVYYHMVEQEVMDSTTIDDGFGGGGGRWGHWGGWGGMGMEMETDTQPRMMGMLAVDMGDVKKKELVWRGQATVDSISETQKGDEKQVLQSIKKMFKQYPPERK